MQLRWSLVSTICLDYVPFYGHDMKCLLKVDCVCPCDPWLISLGLHMYSNINTSCTMRHFWFALYSFAGLLVRESSKNSVWAICVADVQLQAWLGCSKCIWIQLNEFKKLWAHVFSIIYMYICIYIYVHLLVLAELYNMLLRGKYYRHGFLQLPFW